MFNTESRARLAEFSDMVEIRRDCSFFACGKIPTRATAKLVPIGGEKYLPELLRGLEDVAGVVCTPELVDHIPDDLGCAVAQNPVEATYKIHAALCHREDYFWTSFPTKIAASAQIHSTAYVADRDVMIGEGAVIGPNATIMERVIMGDECQIGSNTTIGSQAYEISKIDGRPQILRQAGGVRLGTGVIFLSGCTVARSSFPVFTEIGDFCSFDNLVHVAHDCLLGHGVKMTACSMLSGRVTLGDDVYIGPNATISNGLTIGSGAFITIGSVVVSDVQDGKRVTGNFAVEHSAFKRHIAAIRG